MVPALHQFRNVLLRCSSMGEFPGIDRYRFLTNVECSLGCKLFVSSGPCHPHAHSEAEGTVGSLGKHTAAL